VLDEVAIISPRACAAFSNHHAQSACAAFSSHHAQSARAAFTNRRARSASSVCRGPLLHGRPKVHPGLPACDFFSPRRCSRSSRAPFPPPASNPASPGPR
jgi:hypothetical protein